MLRFIKRLGRKLNFFRNKDGAIAVEFALIGPLFIVFVVSSLELGWTMTKIALIDNAASQAAKFIYIGAASSGTPTQEELEAFICSKLKIVDDCSSNIAIEAVPVSGFNKPPKWNAPCRDSENSNYNPTVRYNPGAGNEIVYLRVCLTTKLLTPGLGLALSLANTETSRMQIVSSLAFMNEPFQE